MTLEQAYKLVTNLDESRWSYFYQTDSRDSSKTTTASKPNFNRSFSARNKPTSSSSSVKPAGSSAKLTISEKRTTSEPVKINPHTQCYRCLGYGHLANQCLSQTQILLVKISIKDVEEKEDDLEVIVHQ